MRMNVLCAALPSGCFLSVTLMPKPGTSASMISYRLPVGAGLRASRVLTVRFFLGIGASISGQQRGNKTLGASMLPHVAQNYADIRKVQLKYGLRNIGGD